MIGMVESLLNEQALRATSSSQETEEAAKQDDFFYLSGRHLVVRHNHSMFTRDVTLL